MQGNNTQVAHVVRDITDLTPDQVIRSVDNGNGTITVTETRTITVKRAEPQKQNIYGVTHIEDLEDLPPPAPAWPLYFIFGALALGMFAALVDVLGEFAAIMQENPLPVMFAIGLLVGAAGLLVSTKGGR